ncbi:hypothetical protein [Candidatus Methylomicrobium oryzae]|uniref:hypothetical protein n=1 Tax=Candidatus Methylomicrobium oryzae TaxID=2802053 RepID=UPI00192251A7|nr:hypothetical protein [Methylomicrobium sp. RS1]
MTGGRREAPGDFTSEPAASFAYFRQETLPTLFRIRNPPLLDLCRIESHFIRPGPDKSPEFSLLRTVLRSNSVSEASQRG